MTLHRFTFILGSVLLLFCLPAGALFAQQSRDMKGWDMESPYNQLYDANELDDFKGVVKKVYTAIPMPGMSPAVVMDVAESEDAVNTVHICPTWFRDPEAIGIRRGDKIKVKGVWAEIDGNFIFMAAKVKKGDYFEFKVRVTSDGTPFWTLSPAQQAMHSNN
ncbi:MAG: hypothetical protein ACOWWM_14760 [Desulfobacterales bacterium]